MGEFLTEIGGSDWQRPTCRDATARLESGTVLLGPDLHFELSAPEQQLFSADCVDGTAKQVSYRPAAQMLQGTRVEGPDRERLAAMMQRYFEYASALIRALLPKYGAGISAGFTSFRPVEIAGRTISWRKDDTRLHIDAFPSRPLQGRRILRVFTNVNPSAERRWRVGGRFEDVASLFYRQVPREVPGLSWLLYRLHITKSRRTPYDHLMLGIHDCMKADECFQRESRQIDLSIPPGATWMCFTDAVSHAVMAGRFALEQTFYLPVEAMIDPRQSPLCILERLTGRTLA